MTGLSLPVANKCRFEARRSPIICRGGREAADLPARLCSAWLGRCAVAQKKRRDIALLGAKHEPAAGDEIEYFRIAYDLHDHRAKAGAGQGIDTSTQSIRCIGRTQQKKTLRFDTHFRKSGWCERAMFERRKILNDPEHPLAAAHTLCRAGRKARSACIRGEDFVHCPAQESAAQSCIGICMAERATCQASACAQNGIEESR